ncbi:MAG: type II CRISPR-associated endonuclease Cas1 [Clostridiales bacterium]|nr:type II CRISPR-associated endonuclease Cas1 [Clostridiales bacterium]
MGYRVLFLANSMKLSVKNEQLVIDNGDVTKIPLEDIECIAVDSMQVAFNSYLLSKISEYAITLYATNKAHHPCGVFLPLNRHSRHLSVLNSQINMPQHLRKQMWKQIVVQKIENQATVLKLCGVEQWESIDTLKKKVKHGDSENMEAVAASQYFKLLFGNGFTRSGDNAINSCLNYGYAIIRSTIAKYLVVYGYEPSLGLFHKSTLNNFNLADDLIEPYRPLVDLFVRKYAMQDEELTTARKAQLVNLLTMDVISNNKIFACAKAVDNTVQSLTSVLTEKTENLILPQLIDLEQHQYE